MSETIADTSLALLTPAEMAEADRLAVIAGVPSLALMQHAGRAVADAVLARERRRGARVLVLCGPGNNGGDGFVAARLLMAAGLDVRVSLLGARDALQGDAAVVAAQWSGAVEPLDAVQLADADIVIDALFGAGLTRPLSGSAAAVVTALNASPVPVVAVDVPSGLDGASGDAGGPVVEADATVTFFRMKPGHLLLPGRTLCGEVVLADIGIPAGELEAISPRTFMNAPALWRGRYPLPRLDGHKYSRGHAVVVSGGPETTGAARLGARGALRSGAGLVTVVGAPAATLINAAHLTAIMIKSIAGRDGLAEFLTDERRNAVLIGPGTGVGPETADWVLTVLAAKAAAVLDADALTSFSPRGQSRPAGGGQERTGSDPEPDADRHGMGFLRQPGGETHRPADLFAAIAGRAAPVVLTPHAGEFKRLFGDIAGSGSKLEQARAAAKVSGAVVVYKGADTVIAAPDGRAAINYNAPPWLATAGSGDVLAGMITGLLAQQMPAFEAACASVWVHGEVGSACGPGLIAEDLPERCPEVIARLAAGRGQTPRHYSAACPYGTFLPP